MSVSRRRLEEDLDLVAGVGKGEKKVQGGYMRGG